MAGSGGTCKRQHRSNVVIPGTFLLLFGIAVAEVVAEASAATLEKSDDSLKASALRGETASLTRSSVYQNQSSTGDNGRDIDPTRHRAHDGENGSDHSSSNDESAHRDEDKSDVSANATRSSDEADSSSSDGGRKPRHGEVTAAESSGKSTSTKAVSEDPLRFFSTNELTAASTKPAFNDSKQDNKRNLGNATLEESSYEAEGMSNTTETAPAKGNIVSEDLGTSDARHSEKESLRYPQEKGKNVTISNEEEAAAIASPGNSSATSTDVKLNEKREKIIKSDYKGSIPKLELREDDDAIDLKESAEDRKSADRDREATTVRGVRSEEDPGSKRNANDLETTASEALDLEKIDEKEHEGTISLINDTYVNHFNKTLTEKDPKGSVNQTADASGLKDDPKAEVEVVRNVTYPPTLKIVVTANDTAKNDSHSTGVNEEAVYIRPNIDASNEQQEEQQEFGSVSNATIKDTDETRKLIGEPESQVKLPETITQSAQREEHTSAISAATPSPVPQGRTIGFSGANEFPSIEVKSAVSTKVSGGLEVSPAPLGFAQNVSQNASRVEKLDEKPYPYVKSSREPFQATTVSALRLETEETSAYENTIGRGESEKKLVVTEASVVIENSIQQQKDEKGANGSRNSTTESSARSTVISIDGGSTNATPPERFNDSAKTTEMTASGSNGNDVPSAKEEEKVTARREGNYVTGNGITEVSLAGKDGKAVKSHSDAATESSRVTMALPKTDVQMEPEEAMMIRSTFDVSESTVASLSGKDLEMNGSTNSMPPRIAEINTEARMILENSTKSTPKTNVMFHLSSSANETAELSSSTLNPDESSVPTTTSIEFEFVGLTEAIFSTSNATERGVEEQTTRITLATSVESSATNESTEDALITTRSEESTELPATTEDGTPTTNQVSIMYQADNETTEVRDLPVTQVSSEDRGNRTESASNEITVNSIDPASAGGLPAVTEHPSISNSSSHDANVTETSASGVQTKPPLSVMTLSSATKSLPASSFSTSTLEPRILWSTPAFTESPDEETTDGIQPIPPEEITLVKIIIEGTLHDVCPRLQDLRKALADVLTNGMDK